MLDRKYENSEISYYRRDTNKYCLKRIASYIIVLTCLVSAGTNQAGSAAFHIYEIFPNLRFILMVGIGGGIPCSSTGEDVRLGDVVVSMPSGTYGGVIQYDSGKFLQKGGFPITGPLSFSPVQLRNVVNFVRANHESKDNCITTYIEEMLRKTPQYTEKEIDYSYSGEAQDLLFNAEYVHKENSGTCADCNEKQLIPRSDRPKDQPIIYYGNIASGSGVIRDATKRDQLGRDYGALCVEMEAAGLMGEFQCLVIRGICDYSDSHKNKEWQRYAAAVAAAYAKELLGQVSRPIMEGSSLIPKSIKDPDYPPQSITSDESNDLRSPSKASPHSVSANPWEIRSGEDVLVEAQIQNYVFSGTRSQGPLSMAQCDLRIFELHGRLSMPTRRITVRSCGPGEQCVSHCRTLWIFDTPQTKSY